MGRFPEGMSVVRSKQQSTEDLLMNLIDRGGRNDFQLRNNLTQAEKIAPVFVHEGERVFRFALECFIGRNIQHERLFRGGGQGKQRAAICACEPMARTNLHEQIVNVTIEDDEVEVFGIAKAISDLPQPQRIQSVEERTHEREVPGAYILVVAKSGCGGIRFFFENSRTHSGSQFRKDGNVIPERYAHHAVAHLGEVRCRVFNLRCLAGSVNARKRHNLRRAATRGDWTMHIKGALQHFQD